MKDINLYYLLFPIMLIIANLGIYLKREKESYKIATIILTFLSMLRFDHGYDYFWYWIVGSNELIKNKYVILLYENLEYGIKKLYDIVRVLGNPQYFFIITGFIISIYMYKFLEQNTRYPIVSLILYLIIPMGFYDFNHYVMQSLAMSIIYYHIKYIFEKKIRYFILIVIMCSIFIHSSCLVCLLFIFMPRRRIKIIEWFGLILVLYFFFKSIFKSIIFTFFKEYYYLIIAEDRIIEANVLNIKLYNLILLGIIFLNLLKKLRVYKFINKKFILSKKERYYYNIFVFGVILTNILTIIYKNDLGKRLGSYFIFLGVISFGVYLDLVKKNILTLIKMIIITSLILIKLYLMIKWEQPLVLNKESSFENLRPNSIGLRLFIGRKYEDMAPYLPHNIKFIRGIK